MKIYSLISFSNFYKDISNQSMDIALAYKLNKILITHKDDIEFYQNKLQEILNDCVELENNNFKMTTDGKSFILKSDKINEFNNRFEELQNFDIKFNNDLKISIDDFKNIQITPKELAQIQEFIQ